MHDEQFNITVINNLASLDEIFFEWDVPNWRRSMDVWEKYIPRDPKYCLELGARNGGLSLMLAMRGHRVMCSDLTSPIAVASKIHETFTFPGSIHYGDVNLLKMNFSQEFDVIIFKSILGGVARNNDVAMAKEIAGRLYNALKPGGIILLAENNAGTFFHRLSRKIFRKWALSWSYFSISQLQSIFSKFEMLELRAFGFLAPFAKGHLMKSLFYAFDRHFDKYIGQNSKYIVVTVLRKPLKMGLYHE